MEVVLLRLTRTKRLSTRQRLLAGVHRECHVLRIRRANIIISTYYKYDAKYKYTVLYVSIFLIRRSFPGIKQSNGTPPETIIGKCARSTKPMMFTMRDNTISSSTLRMGAY